MVITVAGTRGGIDAIRKNAPCAPHALLTPSSRPHSPESQHISALLDDESELRRLVALLVAVAEAEGVPLRKARDTQAVVEQVDAKPVDDRVAQLRRALIKPLRLEELMCCRLYTGPMFMKFNVVMRGASAVPGKLLGKPQWAVDKFKEECRGNKYSTTISAVNSAIIKLSKQTTVNKVYRGVSGFGLPKILTTKNEHNVTVGLLLSYSVE